MFFRQPTQQKDEIEILLDKVHSYQKKINLSSDANIKFASSMYSIFHFISLSLNALNAIHTYTTWHCTPKIALVDKNTNLLAGDFIDGRIQYNQDYYLKMLLNAYTEGQETAFIPEIRPKGVYDYNGNGIFHENGETVTCEYHLSYQSKLHLALCLSYLLKWFFDYLVSYSKRNPIFNNPEYIDAYTNAQEFLEKLYNDFDELDTNSKEELAALKLIDDTHNPKFYCPLTLAFIVNPIVVEHISQNDVKFKKIYDSSVACPWINEHNTDPSTFVPLTVYGFSPTTNKEHTKYFRDLARKVNELKLRSEVRFEA